eukprot:5995751-Prymnesium_polylepis.2
MQLDQAELVRSLPEGVPIPRLKQRLLALLEQASNQVELTQACVAVAQADHQALIQKRHRMAKRGTLHGPTQ